MTDRRIQKPHEGELFVQKKRHTPDELAEQILSYINTDMPQQHAIETPNFYFWY